MRSIGIIFILQLIILSGYAREKREMETTMVPPVVCYASGESHPVYIKPPYDLMNSLKSTGSSQANIIVTYDGFTDEPKAAFQFAVDIIAGLISSPVPIHILAKWTSLDQNVLGSAGPNGYYKNFESAILKDRYYPVALAEKLARKEINGVSRSDIVASFNKDIQEWYFNADGNTPSDKYDFASVVMHEIIHGLGFTGFFESNDGVGSCHLESGFGNGIPGVFDEFILNEQGQQLVDTSLFANPSILLHTNLTSNALVFNSFLSGSTKPVLYAPSDWDDGSSVYHLDENVYHSGENALMTPYSSKGEAIYDPGPFTMDIMNEMGWKSIRIEHEELKDMESIDGPISIGAFVESDFDLYLPSIFVFYSEDNFLTTDSVLLQPTDTANYYAGSFLPSGSSGAVRYYISASDVMARTFTLPAQAPDDFFSFQVGEDTEVPVVSHHTFEYILSSWNSVKVSVEASDNVGVESVTLRYLVNNGRYNKVILQKDSANIYSGIMEFEQGTLWNGDVVKYYISVVDASLQSNETRIPAQGLYTVPVEVINNPVTEYFNDFNSTSNDFIGSDFEIARPSQFNDAGLNTDHPYLCTEDLEETFDFYTILRYPVYLGVETIISYDEVVLVEPGDDNTGKQFGDEDFWDYVIVEGSRDGGITWLPLIDGYDSRSNTSWYIRFISQLDLDDNSSATGSNDLYINRNFNLISSGNFLPGEAILIRFRLFSDPFANGWGWIIDNLMIIENQATSVSQTVSPGELIFYPNPATDLLTVNLKTEKEIQEISIRAFNVFGEIVQRKSVAVNSRSYSETLDMRNFKPGIYLFSIQVDGGQVLTRKVVIE